MDYKALEMHTHTLHSDGTFTVEALCRAARELDFDGLAITDHNTLAPYEQLTPALEMETLPVVRGIEWTTFFGHLLVLGCDRYVDWRFATPGNIDDYLREIHRQNGVVGIAHPFELGSPFCTGGHWQFEVRDWEAIDYIEVWSEPSPQLKTKNIRALQWWTDLLNRGYHIAATQGRDWHGPSQERESRSATYLGVENGVVNTETAKEALRKGRSFVTCGPGLALHAEQNGRCAGLGETVRPGQAVVEVSIDSSLRRAQWEGFGIRPRKLQLIHNGAVLAQIPCQSTAAHSLELTLCPGWIRLEAVGDYQGREDTLLAFTSPIYIAY